MKSKTIILTSALLLFFSFLIQCGGGSSNNSDTNSPPPDDGSGADSTESIVTEKLIGTPFENKTNGDEFAESTFLCGDYATRTISELPMKIFLAFFTSSEEEIIEEGIGIANKAAGTPLFETADSWSNDLRVIYRVSTIPELDNAIGVTDTADGNFNNNFASEAYITDWAIRLKRGANRWTVAHELGHSVGLVHRLIDYENNTYEDLEENSLMEPNGGGNSPALNDYTFMMTKQAEIINQHLGASDFILWDPCD